MTRNRWIKWQQSIRRRKLERLMFKHGLEPTERNHNSRTLAAFIAKRAQYPWMGILDNYLEAAVKSQVKVSINDTKQRLEDGRSKAGRLKHRIYKIKGGFPHASRYIRTRLLANLTKSEAAMVRADVAQLDIRLKLADLKVAQA